MVKDGRVVCSLAVACLSLLVSCRASLNITFVGRELATASGSWNVLPDAPWSLRAGSGSVYMSDGGNGGTVGTFLQIGGLSSSNGFLKDVYQSVSGGCESPFV